MITQVNPLAGSGWQYLRKHRLFTGKFGCFSCIGSHSIESEALLNALAWTKESHHYWLGSFGVGLGMVLLVSACVSQYQLKVIQPYPGMTETPGGGANPSPAQPNDDGSGDKKNIHGLEPFDGATTVSMERLATENAFTLLLRYWEEYRQIFRKRLAAGEPPVAIFGMPWNTRGVSLSGGGIRAAAFHLGVLRGLHELGMLENMDYVASVSGGSWIAAWFMTHFTIPDHELFNPNGPRMKDLFGNADYLSPGHAGGSGKYMISRGVVNLMTLPLHWLGNGVFSLGINAGDESGLSIRKAYQERLAKTFLSEDAAKMSIGDLAFGDNGRISVLSSERNPPGWISSIRPIWIVLATLVLSDDEGPDKNHLGTSFEIGTITSGSDATGYVKTDRNHDWMTISAAIQISAAAFTNQNEFLAGWTGYVIRVFNMDLGRYIDSWQWDNRLTWRNVRYFLTAFYPIHKTIELLGGDVGHTLTSYARRFFVTDGALYENLGAYSLIIRGVRFIIISDATADPNYLEGKDRWYAYFHLQRLAFRLLSELGVELEIPVPGNGECRPVTLGRIRNLPVAGGGATDVQIVYIKPTYDRDCAEKYPSWIKMIAGRLRGKDFPHESTANQSYDEAQFRAYVELGYKTVMNNSEMFLDFQKQYLQGP